MTDGASQTINLTCAQFVHTIKHEVQWDPQKAGTNLTKHGVDFADAVGVLEDGFALTLKEQDADGEQRLVTVGCDFLGRILVVVYTYRADEIRLVSARRATGRERRDYERQRI